MGREPYFVTREEAERQVAMLQKAKEEFFAKQQHIRPIHDAKPEKAQSVAQT